MVQIITGRIRKYIHPSRYQPVPIQRYESSRACGCPAEPQAPPSQTDARSGTLSPVRRPRAWFWPALFVLAAVAAGGWWYFSGPREITVLIFPDYAFRQRANWKELLVSRFGEVARIFASQTGVRWKLAGIETEDPINHLGAPLDTRRNELARDTHHPADWLLIVTGMHEPGRTGSITPFSHAGLVVDFPDQSELRNVLITAHEMAHLFGAPQEPGTSTLMAPVPNDTRLSRRAVALIQRLRRFPFRQGTAALKGSWDDAALQALEIANRGLPSNSLSRAHRMIAAALAIDEHYAPAIRHLREAVRIDPASMPVRVELAVTLVRDTQPDAAITVLRDSIRVNPRDSTLHSMLASLLARQDYEAAVDESRTAVQLDPHNAFLQEELGTLLTAGVGRIDEAIAAYQAALRLDPSMERARRGLALAQQFKENARAEAARLSGQADAARSDGNLYYVVGVAQLRAGDLDAAARSFDRTLALNPKAADPHGMLGMLHYIRGDYAGALAELRKAGNLGSPLPQSLMAAIQARMKR